jgi:hypothetical protein
MKMSLRRMRFKRSVLRSMRTALLFSKRRSDCVNEFWRLMH